MAEYLTLPVANLHLVPDQITDKEACFAEPLAAACRIAEQQVLNPNSSALLFHALQEHALAMRSSACLSSL